MSPQRSVLCAAFHVRSAALMHKGLRWAPGWGGRSTFTVEAGMAVVPAGRPPQPVELE